MTLETLNWIDAYAIPGRIPFGLKGHFHVYEGHFAIAVYASIVGMTGYFDFGESLSFQELTDENFELAWRQAKYAFIETYDDASPCFILESEGGRLSVFTSSGGDFVPAESF